MQAKNYYDLITKAGELRDDLTVVFVSHIINDGTDIDPQYKMYSSGNLEIASITPNSVKAAALVFN